jgi:hypothetical protein
MIDLTKKLLMTYHEISADVKKKLELMWGKINGENRCNVHGEHVSCGPGDPVDVSCINWAKVNYTVKYLCPYCGDFVTSATISTSIRDFYDDDFDVTDYKQKIYNELFDNKNLLEMHNKVRKQFDLPYLQEESKEKKKEDIEREEQKEWHMMEYSKKEKGFLYKRRSVLADIFETLQCPDHGEAGDYPCGTWCAAFDIFDFSRIEKKSNSVQIKCHKGCFNHTILKKDLLVKL